MRKLLGIMLAIPAAQYDVKTMQNAHHTGNNRPTSHVRLSVSRSQLCEVEVPLANVP